MNEQLTYKDGVGHRPAFDYDPEREAPGEVIQRLVSHANTEINDEDAATMNGAIFTDLSDVLNYISAAEGIAATRVYQALHELGRDKCYHQFKTNGGDVFADIKELIIAGRLSIDNPSKRAAAATNMTIFNDVRVKKFRSWKQTVKISSDYAEEIAIRSSQLNLYYVMHGVKYLVRNEPTYIQYETKPMFKDVLLRLQRAEALLIGRRDILEATMSI